MTRKEQIFEKADDIIKNGRGMIGHKELVAMAEWCDANPFEPKDQNNEQYCKDFIEDMKHNRKLKEIK